MEGAMAAQLTSGQRELALPLDKQLALVRADFASVPEARTWLAEVRNDLRPGRSVTENFLLSKLFLRWVDTLPDTDEFKQKYTFIARGGSNAQQEMLLKVLETFQSKMKEGVQNDTPFVGDLRTTTMTKAIKSIARREEQKNLIHGESADTAQLKAYKAKGVYLPEFQRFLASRVDVRQLAYPAQVEAFLDMMTDRFLAQETQNIGDLSQLSEKQQDAIVRRIQPKIQKMQEALLRPTRAFVSGESQSEDEDDNRPGLLEQTGVEQDELSTEQRGIVSFLETLASGDRSVLAGLPEFWGNYLVHRVSGGENNKPTAHEAALTIAQRLYRKKLNDPKALPPRLPSEPTAVMRQRFRIFNTQTFWHYVATGSFSPSDSPRSNPMPRAQVLYPRYTRHGGVNSGNVPVHVPGVPFTQFPNVFARNPDDEMRSTEARFGGKCKVSGEPYEAGTTIYKHPTLGWCTQAGLDMAASMSEGQIAAMMADRQRNKHLTEAEQEAWMAMGGSITKNGRPIMDRKFVSIKNAKAMLQQGGAMANPLRLHRF